MVKNRFLLFITFFSALLQILFLNIHIAISAPIDIKVFTYPNYKRVLFFTDIPIDLIQNKNELILNFEDSVDLNQNYLLENLKEFVNSIELKDNNKLFKMILNSSEYEHDIIRGEGFSGFDIIKRKKADKKKQVKKNIAIPVLKASLNQEKENQEDKYEESYDLSVPLSETKEFREILGENSEALVSKIDSLASVDINNSNLLYEEDIADTDKEIIKDSNNLTDKDKKENVDKPQNINTSDEKKIKLPANEESREIPQPQNLNNSESVKKMSFSFEDEVGSAVFIRGDVLWVVFDTNIYVDIANILSENEEYLKKGFIVENRQYTILRFYMKKKSNIILSKNKNEIFINFSEEKPKNKKEVKIEFDDSGRLALKLFVHISEKVNPLRLLDPDIGDEIMIVPMKDIYSRVSKEYISTDFVILKTFQGVAIQLNSDNILLEQKKDKLSLVGPTNFLVSNSLSSFKKEIEIKKEVNPDKEKEVKIKDSLLDFDSWGRSEEGNFIEVLNKLTRNFSEVEESEKGAVLFDLAGFYFAKALYPEAVSIISLIEKYDKKKYLSLETQMIKASSLGFINKYREALDVFSFIEKNNTIPDYYREEVSLWEDLISVKILNDMKADNFLSKNPMEEKEKRKFKNIDSLEKYSDLKKKTDSEQFTSSLEEADIFSFGIIIEKEKGTLWFLDTDLYENRKLNIYSFLENKDGFLSYYPDNIYNILGELAFSQSISESNIGMAEQILLSFRKMEDNKITFKNDIQYLKGLMHAKDEDYNVAVNIWKPLTEDFLDNRNRARSVLATTILHLAYSKISLSDAINNLNHIKFTWRSDIFDFSMLRLLGYLYIENNQYLQGLRVWRDLVSTYPNTQESFLIEKEMSKVFLKIFEKNKITTMGQLKALTLYYEFQSLIPIGNKGDIIVSNLIDRLIDVNLLDKASALLHNQIKFRLRGKKREEAIFKLIKLYMRNSKPNEVLKILEETKKDYMNEKVKLDRKYFKAEALIQSNKIAKAVNLIKNDYSIRSSFLKADIYWGLKDWKNVIRELRGPLRDIQRNERMLNKQETEQLLHLAISYAITGKKDHLKYLYNHFLPFISEKKYRRVISFLSEEGYEKTSSDIEKTLNINNLEDFLDNYLEIRSNES